MREIFHNNWKIPFSITAKNVYNGMYTTRDWIYTKLNDWAKTKATRIFNFDCYLDENLKPHNILRIALINTKAVLNVFRDA